MEEPTITDARTPPRRTTGERLPTPTAASIDRVLRIAQVAPLYERVPPRQYGGTERIVGYLCNELTRRGHEVTLFATADSLTDAALCGVTADAVRDAPLVDEQIAPHMLEMAQAFGEYWKWTADETLMRELWPAVMGAIGWITDSRAVDAMGYLTYARRTAQGFLQQGWKDSHDSVMHASGELAPAPIALIEVQAYKHAALRMASLVAGALGYADLARALRERAAELQERVERDFWLDEERFYALALDADRAPVASSRQIQDIACGRDWRTPTERRWWRAG